MKTKKVVIGNATLYLGRCEDVLTMLESESVDSVVTDPPYLYLKHKLDVPFDEDVVFEEWFRVLKNDRLIAFFGRGDGFFRWNLMLDMLGFKFKESLIWEKENASNFLCNLMRIHEDFAIRVKGEKPVNKCFVDYMEYQLGVGRVDRVLDMFRRLKSAFNGQDAEAMKRYINEGAMEFSKQSKSKHEITAKNMKQMPKSIGMLQTLKRGKVETSILRVERERYQYEHPTQKPVKLMTRILNLVSEPNDLILDPFMGGGSTGVACIASNRRFIGIEKEEDYFKTACKRIKNAHLESARVSFENASEQEMRGAA